MRDHRGRLAQRRRRAAGYIIGSEVPVPGGAHETFEELVVTTPEAAHATIEAHRRAFARHGVEAAWTRVIGLVVQPGVEFDHHQVIDYVRSKAAALSRSIEPVAGMVFEAHSTDYQTPAALEALVQDHFAILKVGPGLTFALREALWALVGHRDGTGSDAGRIAQGYGARGDAAGSPALEALTTSIPSRQDFDLQYSLSDRIRYYWTAPEVERACAQLLESLAAGDSADADQPVPAGAVRRDPRGPAEQRAARTRAGRCRAGAAPLRARLPARRRGRRAAIDRGRE